MPTVELFEVKEKLLQDYKFLNKNRIHFLKNDDEIDADECSHKMDYITEMLRFITGKEGEDLSQEIEAFVEGYELFDPENEEVPMTKGTIIELGEDLEYGDAEDLIDSQDCLQSEQDFIKEGFTITKGKLIIPKGTIMVRANDPEDSWPSFDLRMKYHDVNLDFAGSPFKIKTIL